MMFVAIKDNKPIAWSDSELEVDTDGVTYVETDDVLTGMPDHYDYDASTKKFTKNNKGLFFDVREKRNRLLKDSDYTQLSDSVHKGTKEDWKTYRQKLRDITKDVSNPDDITFPEEPK